MQPLTLRLGLFPHALALSVLLLSAACQKSSPPEPSPPAEPSPQPPPAGPKTVAEAPNPAPTAAPAARGKLNPADLNETAPATYKARFITSKGEFVVAVTRDFSPNGADRFYNLVKHGYYDGTRFFRVVSNFMVQWGISGDPALNNVWRNANIPDDNPADNVRQSNKRGFISFAKTSAPNSRSTQVFINFKDNAFLDSMGFTPFGQVIKGMEIVDKLYAEYGDGAPQGRGPDQMRLQLEGNAYLDRDFPKLDYIEKAEIIK